LSIEDNDAVADLKVSRQTQERRFQCTPTARCC